MNRIAWLPILLIAALGCDVGSEPELVAPTPLGTPAVAEPNGSAGATGDEVAEAAGGAVGEPSPAAAGGAAPLPESACEWPVGMAAVSLTYDDGLSTHLSIAGPALEAHGLRGTFFVGDVRSGATAWRALRDQGHELGAHTFNHPCPASNTWVAAGNANEDYDLARMATELDDNIAVLESLGQAAPHSFAYPCGVTWVGEGQESYVGLVSERFIAARGVAGALAQTDADPYNVPAYFRTGTGADLISLVEQAQAAGAWVVFGFHGVGGDHSAVSAEAHEELLAFLAQNLDTVYVAPFGTVAACLGATP